MTDGFLVGAAKRQIAVYGRARVQSDNLTLKNKQVF